MYLFYPGNTTFSPELRERCLRENTESFNYSNSLKASEQMQEVLDSTNKIKQLELEPQHDK
jgi:hypothetical protein